MFAYFGAKTFKELCLREPSRLKVRRRWSVRNGIPTAESHTFRAQGVGPVSRGLDVKPSSQEKRHGTVRSEMRCPGEAARESSSRLKLGSRKVLQPGERHRRRNGKQ